MTRAGKVRLGRSLSGSTLVNESIQGKSRSSSRRQVPNLDADGTNAWKCKDTELLQSLKNSKGKNFPRVLGMKDHTFNCLENMFLGGGKPL